MDKNSGLSQIPTKAAQLRKEAAETFKGVVYERYKKKEDRKSTSKQNVVIEENVMDMKKVRYDVFKFGMSGFKGAEKLGAEIDMAVRLGAKPPKKQYYNYKQLKKLKAEEAEKLEEQKRQQLLTIQHSNYLKNPANPLKRKTERGGILDPYGKPGKVKSRGKKRRK